MRRIIGKEHRSLQMADANCQSVSANCKLLSLLPSTSRDVHVHRTLDSSRWTVHVWLIFHMPQFIYTIKGLGKVHPPDIRVLDDIWLSFYFGAKIGVLGANGAGKSSLLRI